MRMVVGEMIRTTSLYEMCHELFAGYPLASATANPSGTFCSMILMLQDGDDVKFFVLSRDRHEQKVRYSLRSWRAADIVDIEDDGSAAIPDTVINAVMRGVPLPQDGSLFGGISRGAIRALVAVYTTYTPAWPEPSWMVMPRAEDPKTQWPPFTNVPLFGHWFWEDYRAGNIVAIGDLIAATPDTVFWVGTREILGSDCCAIVRDVRSPEGHMLQHGRYVYHEALRADKAVPSLTELLANYEKTDLAPRFRRAKHQDS
jgi:hypothetical protein